MNALVKAMKAKENQTVTQNGMPASVSTTDTRLDFFYKVPSQRKTGFKSGKYQSFVSAYDSNPTDALRILFWLRDIRKGSGERNSFQGIMNLAAQNGKFPAHLIQHIPEYGRWDDVLSLFNTPLEADAIYFYATALKEGNALAAKWCPRLSGKHRSYAHKIRKALKLDPKSFRKLLAKSSKVVETKMCDAEWSDIDYSKVPSVAMSRYTAAFSRNDEDRFGKYVLDNEMNGKDLFPHDVMRMQKSGKVKDNMINAMWKALPNDVVAKDENVISVVDTSASMTWTTISGIITPMDVAISMGVYLSQRLKGAFKNHFISFNRDPQLIDIGDRTFTESASLMRNSRVGMNTDIEAVFKLILQTALDGSVPAEDMPTKVVIFSDMQFDRCASNPDQSFMNMMSTRYQNAGYEMPRVIFWNLNAGSDSVSHADAGDRKATLVGGFSTRLMSTVFNDTRIEETVEQVIEDGEVVEKVISKVVQKTPLEMMEDVINSERYSVISA